MSTIVLFIYLMFLSFFLFYGCHLFWVAWQNFDGGFEDLWHLQYFYFIELGSLACFALSFYIFDKLVKYYGESDVDG